MEGNILEQQGRVVEKYMLLMGEEPGENGGKPYFVKLFDFMECKGVIGNEIGISGPSELGDVMDKLNIKGK